MKAPDRLAGRLRTLMVERRLTQSALAQTSGVSQSQISRILSGKSALPRDTTLSQLAEALGVSLGEILGDTALPGTFSDDAFLDGERLRSYLEEVLAESDRVDIRGIASSSGAGRTALSFPIESIYVPLRAWQADDSGARVTVADILSRARHVLVTGQPGSGKTTLLRYVAATLARAHLGRPGGDGPCQRPPGFESEGPTPLPVLVRIASLASLMRRPDVGLAAASPRWLVRYLEARFEEETASAILRRVEEGHAALLLDGLDEVADPVLRDRVVTTIDAILQRWGANRVLVTSRPFGYEGVAGLRGVETVAVDDFADADIEEFLDRWVGALYPGGSRQMGDDYRHRLRAAIVESHAVRHLARNPVMLTCLCVVHWNERRLPEGKADLVSAVLRWLLQARDDKRRERGWSTPFAQECFKALAFAMTTAAGGPSSIVDRSFAAESLARPFAVERGVSDPTRVRREGLRFLEAEMLDSGVLEAAALGELRFWHLTFQEHYTGVALAELGDEDGPDGWWWYARDFLFDRRWWEVLDHFVGMLARTGRRRLHLLVHRVLDLAPPEDLAETARVAGVLGRMLRTLAAYDFRPPSDSGWEEARARVLTLFTPEGAAAVPAWTRVEAARALGQGGDPRLAGPLEDRMLPLPGRAGVSLGRYPATVHEFARFVEDGGYQEDLYWSDAGRAARGRLDWREPQGWETQLGAPNHPVTGVSRHEADAFARWVATQAGQPVRLPTESEWAAAAVRSDGPYPWGAHRPSQEHASYDLLFSGPTPVGVFPAGAGPGGHLDLAGNVWEWCSDGPGVLRGGSWMAGESSLRSAVRQEAPSELRLKDFGFRLALGRPANRLAGNARATEER